METVIKRLSLRTVAKIASQSDYDWSTRDAALRLIQNATILDIGCMALGSDLEMLLKHFVILPFAEMEAINDRWARFGCILQNASASSLKFRSALLRRSTAIIKKLLPHLRCASTERRRGVAAILKHCALDRDEHFYLFDELGAGAHIVNALAQPDDIHRLDLQQRTTLQAFAGDIDTRREPDSDVALLLLEALFCFCATRRIRKALKNACVYPVIRDCDYAFAGVLHEDKDDSILDASNGILVTTDSTTEHSLTANDNDDTSNTRISRVCADLADMLLRDDEEQIQTIEHTFAQPNSNTPSSLLPQNSNEKAAPFSSIKAGFLSSSTASKEKKNQINTTKKEEKNFQSVVVTDEELAAKVDAFDLPD
mmetsp:Transcript_9208/g.12755  ORF Transcript_9208/g.12755 Transcript_9208/m.12755 type:complete len:368 (-) Transcript_9208:41-1144(-)